MTKTYHPSLYPFQAEGVDFLIEHGRGFILDDAGLGKTRQAAVAAHTLAPDGPILIVCPNALKRWWKQEILTLYPNDRFHIATATVGGRFKASDAAGRFDANIPLLFRAASTSSHIKMPKWVICHYAGIRISQKYYAQIPWEVIIADECHYIKNRKARRTQAIKEIANTTHPNHIRPHLIGLTATPFSANLADMWSQLHWMAPEVRGLRSYWRFYNLFVDYTMEYNPRSGTNSIRKIKGGKNLETFSTVVAAYGIRRSKATVAPQLPPLRETRMPLVLPPKNRQAKVYKVLASDAVEVVIRHTQLLDQESSSAHSNNVDAFSMAVNANQEDELHITGLLIKNMLTRLIRMEQWLSCPWEFDPGVKGVKLEWLLEWAKSTAEPGMVVTRFRKTAIRIAQELGSRVVYGGVSQRTRDTIIKAWKDGEFQFLVGTIHTLGTGLNLDRAHTMVCYDQVTSSILMGQLRDRIHRLTTDHPVQVIYLFIEKTSNEVVLESFANKWRQLQLVRRFIEHIQSVANRPIT